MDCKYSKLHSKGQFSKDRPTVISCHLSYIGKLSEFSGICRFCAVFLNQINAILMFFHFPLKNTYTKVIFFSVTSNSWAQIECNYYIYFLLEKKWGKAKVKQPSIINRFHLKYTRCQGSKKPPNTLFQFMWPSILSVMQVMKPLMIHHSENKVFCILQHGSCCL